MYRQAEYAVDTAAPGQWRGVPGFHMIRDQTEDMVDEGKVNVLVQMNRRLDGTTSLRGE